MKFFSAISIFAIVLSTATSALGQTAAVTAVHAFTGPDGTDPSSIIQASDGNLWGTAEAGGSKSAGTIFKIYPDGTLVTVYDFASSTDPNAGFGPVSLIEGNDGNFYGVTQDGGDGAAGMGYCQCGIFFRITPTGQFTNLYSFGTPDGAAPNPGLVQGTDGNFYGTNEYVIYAISPSGTILGYGPISTMPIVGAGPLQHTNGAFYGATTHDGIVYSYTLQQGLGRYRESTSIGLGYSFAEGTDGNIYGAGNDVAFRFSPEGAYKTFSTDFDAATGLTSASDGNVYGLADYSVPIFNITPLGAVNRITTTAAPEVTAPTLRVTPIQASDGSFLIPIEDDGTSINGIYRYTLTPALPSPIQLMPSESTIALGSSFTLNWEVLNATSATLRQCNAFLSRPGKGGGDWSGLQSGTVTSGIYSGSATLTPTAGGSFIYALTCGGVESGFATVTVTGGSASATSTLLQASASTIAAGSPLTLSATVTSNTGGYLPTGTVTFNDGSYVLATVAVDSHSIAAYTAAAGTTSHLAGGSYSITAHYNGDANDTASTSAPLTIAVQGITAVALVISPPSFTVGGSTTMTATVRDINGGPVPTGTVNFYYSQGGDSNYLGVGYLNPSTGVTSVTTPLNPVLAAGSYPVTAQYLGDTYSQPSTSPVVTLNVTTPTTTALTVFPSSVTNGQYVTLTATISATGGSVVSGGTVAFTSGSITAATATVNSSGVASATVLVQNIPPGTYPITANYKGTSIYSPSASAPTNVTVTQ